MVEHIGLEPMPHTLPVYRLFEFSNKQQRNGAKCYLKYKLHPTAFL